VIGYYRGIFVWNFQTKIGCIRDSEWHLPPFPEGLTFSPTFCCWEVRLLSWPFGFFTNELYNFARIKHRAPSWDLWDQTRWRVLGSIYLDETPSHLAVPVRQSCTTNARLMEKLLTFISQFVKVFSHPLFTKSLDKLIPVMTNTKGLSSLSPDPLAWDCLTQKAVNLKESLNSSCGPCDWTLSWKCPQKKSQESTPNFYPLQVLSCFPGLYIW